MAGNYPDVPSWRIPYDQDGSVGVTIDDSNNVTQLTGGNLQTLNDESNSAVGIPYALCIIFPRLMDIDGGFWAGGAGAGGWTMAFAWSPDTTNGVDGTWTTFTPSAGARIMGGLIPGYRNAIWAGTLGGVRAIRLNYAGGAVAGGININTFHLYGEPTDGQDENRLEFWHPTENHRIGPAYFDWGNVPRSSTEDRQFRVKNLSGGMTATSIRLSFEALSDTSPSVPGQHQVSADGLNFYAQRTISSLAPGAVSSIYTVRRITPSDAVFSLWTLRANAEVTGGWSV